MIQADSNFQLSTVVENLKKISSGQGAVNLFVIVDGAKNKKIEPLLNNYAKNFVCLYSGVNSYALKRAAPYLVQINLSENFSKTLLTHVLEDRWGILLIASGSTSLNYARNHFRRIAKIDAPSGKAWVFRYYEPSVLGLLLPIFTEEELNKVFGPCYSLVTGNNLGEVNAYYRMQESPSKCVSLNISRSEALLPKESIYVAKHITPAPLKIGKEWLDAINKKNEIQFFRELKKEYCQTFDYSLTDKAFTGSQQVDLDQFLLMCYRKAKQFKLDTSYSFLIFFSQCHAYGIDFWLKPQYKRVAEILNSERFSNNKVDEIDRQISRALMDQMWS